ncbi:MAG: FlgD immunoglobulin-like domain containing protein, partial [bacterium]
SGRISVVIFTMNGVQIRAFDGDTIGNTRESFRWDGRNASGALVPPGPYAVSVRGPDVRFLGKCTVRR